MENLSSVLRLYAHLGWVALFLYGFWRYASATLRLFRARSGWDYGYNYLLCAAAMAFTSWVVYHEELSRMSTPWYWLVGHVAVLSLLLCPFGWLCARVFGLARGRVEAGSFTLNHLARLVAVLFGWTMAVAYEYHVLPYLL